LAGLQKISSWRRRRDSNPRHPVRWHDFQAYSRRRRCIAVHVLAGVLSFFACCRCIEMHPFALVLGSILGSTTRRRNAFLTASNRGAPTCGKQHSLPAFTALLVILLVLRPLSTRWAAILLIWVLRPKPSRAIRGGAFSGQTFVGTKTTQTRFEK